jgi:hypothetical protein
LDFHPQVMICDLILEFQLQDLSSSPTTAKSRGSLISKHHSRHDSRSHTPGTNREVSHACRRALLRPQSRGVRRGKTKRVGVLKPDVPGPT